MVATPNILTDPGALYIAPLATSLPTNTVVGGVFTDAWSASWIPLGATEEGSEFAFAIDVEAIRVAELVAPVAYRTVEQSGSIGFALASYTASNLNRAFNGGIAAMTATSGATTTALYTVEPPEAGSEVRAMIGWESLDRTVRLVARQTLQGGEITIGHKKAPDLALIPCTFNMEQPSASKMFSIYTAGSARG